MHFELPSVVYLYIFWVRESSFLGYHAENPNMAGICFTLIPITLLLVDQNNFIKDRIQRGREVLETSAKYVVYTTFVIHFNKKKKKNRTSSSSSPPDFFSWVRLCNPKFIINETVRNGILLKINVLN